MKYDEREQMLWVQSVLADRGYTCLKLAGKGAFSSVYCLEDRRDGRLYACKVSAQVNLLEQEAEIMLKLQHPLFTKCFGFWQEAGKGFLLMEYVPGSNVEEMLRRRKRFSVEQALRMGMELAEGLRALHEGQEAFVFRDVKPENMIIQQNGIVKLIDFGCTCALGKKAAFRAGTPGFAAPEQMQGEGVLTAACDVYGWGQTMKALLGVAERNIIMQNAADSINRKWAEERAKNKDKKEKVERAEKIVNEGKEEKAKRSEKIQNGKVEKAERAEKIENTGKAEKTERAEKIENTGKVEKTERAEKIENTEKEEKAERVKKVDKKEKSEKMEKAAWDSWIDQEGRQGRKVRKQLYHILEACTKREASERIPDMRGVMAALMPFMSLCVGNEDKKKNRKSFYFQKGIVCEKNIIIMQL